jgi:hypothetical protein
MDMGAYDCMGLGGWGILDMDPYAWVQWARMTQFQDNICTMTQHNTIHIRNNIMWDLKYSIV